MPTETSYLEISTKCTYSFIWNSSERQNNDIFNINRIIIFSSINAIRSKGKSLFEKKNIQLHNVNGCQFIVVLGWYLFHFLYFSAYILCTGNNIAIGQKIKIDSSTSEHVSGGLAVLLCSCVVFVVLQIGDENSKGHLW